MIRPLTKHCYDSLMQDVWPRQAAVVDFGIDTQEHYNALQIAARNGATPEDFDKALGDGAKLTTLVKKYGSNVNFNTLYDGLPPEEY